MKNRWTVMAALITLVLALSNITPAFAQDPPVENLVWVELSQGNWSFTDEDAISNVPREWYQSWLLNIINNPDVTGLSITNPQVVAESSLNFIWFSPDDPTIFYPQPDLGTYTWSFNGLEIEEAEHLPIFVLETDEPIVAKPRFSASRHVTPVTLNNPVTRQDVEVRFKLEEPLPPEVNNLAIIVGNVNLAYEEYRLVESRFVFQSPVEGWQSWNDGTRAYWFMNDPSSVEIGKTYVFLSTIEAVKSPDLLGSPTSKPYVQIAYVRWRYPEPVVSNSIELVHSDSMRATYTVKEEVKWTPGMSDFRFDFGFNQVISQITPPPPPFHVLIPADIRIEPETLNLKSKGVITAFVQLPEQYSVEDIDVSTVKCQGAPAISGVIDGNTLILKFNRQDLQDVQPGEEVELLVTGQLIDGSIFEGIDVIRVIH